MNPIPALSRLTAVLALALLLAACGADEAEDTTARPALVIQPGAAEAGISAYAGEVRARYEPALGFRIGGKIARRLVDVGDAVKKGQVLAELDAADVGLQREAARAQLASARSDEALARAERDRYQSLLERKLVSQSLYDARVTEHEAALSRLRQARAQAEVAENQASYAQLRAPADGLVAARLAEAGQVVAAGQTVFVLAEDGEREVAISVPERDAAGFAPGREFAIELWSRPGERYPGVLREIAPNADPQARTYAARIRFQAGAELAELGQSARAYAAGDAGRGLRVPLPALTEKDGQPAVWVVDPASARVSLRPVEVGPYGEQGVPVLSGLAPGEWIVAAGVHLLLEGQRIKPIDRDNRPVALAAAAPATPAAD